MTSKPDIDRDSGRKGFGLIEIMMAIAILGIMALSLSMVLQFVGTTTVKSREQTYAVNFAERCFVRLNNIPYPFIYAVDSSSANYGLTGTYGPVTNQTATYPYLAILNDLRGLMSTYKFDRFTLEVRFMVRDLGDLDSDGETADLRVFTDSNGDLIDDYDVGVRYQDQNADLDYRDTYFTTSEITEEPHTRLKEVTLKIYKQGQVLYTDTRLVSWEKFTGAEGKAAGATLRIVVTTPAENSHVYSLQTAAQQDAFNLNLTLAYPSDIVAVRADNVSPLRIAGETTPSSDLFWTLQTSTNAVLDTCTADVLGAFDCPSINVTAGLIEGLNTLYGQATKGVYYSPWTPVTFIRDINPPAVSSQTPSGTTYNAQPVIRARITDEPVTAGRSVAGLNTELTLLRINGTTVPYQYNAATGYVTWIDSTTGMPPVVATGAYTAVLEGGDNAFYKVRSTWTFILNVGLTNDFTDNSAPSVTNKDPIGISFDNPPVISVRVFDNQSGIILDSVVMKLDGVVVVSSTTGNLLTAWTPLDQQDGGSVTYTPPDPLSAGAHTVTIDADHWATDPTNKIHSNDSWNFNIP